MLDRLVLQRSGLRVGVHRHGPEPETVPFEPGQEIVHVLPLRVGPEHLRQGANPWIRKALDRRHGGHVLGPEHPLSAQDVMLLVFGQLLRHGLVSVDVLEGDHPGLGHSFPGLPLAAIKVGFTDGGHDDVVAVEGGLDPPLLPPPAHDGGGRGQLPPLKYLVPADGPPSEGRKVISHLLYVPALQLVRGSEAQIRHPLPNSGVRCPLLLLDLVPPEMHKPTPGEQLRGGSQDVPDEL
mmetsp:Transcript_34962/g.71504  ORF Transcript_34962/g.71504 Transcript_34962/m.71504 type:complete len:237 (+) Transcript_34962:85-795(+)